MWTFDRRALNENLENIKWLLKKRF